MANLTAWYDTVLPDAPGVLQAFALRKIRDAAIEFCMRSLIWLDDHAPINVVQDVGSYSFAPPAGAVVVKPALVWHDGKPLVPKNKDELAALYQQWTIQSGPPLYYLGTQPDKLRVVPTPNAALVGGLKLMCHFKPSQASTTVPDWLFEEYQEAITCGALGRLKILAKKPYSDPNGAAINLAVFEDEIGKAKVRAFKALGRATPRVSAQFF